MRADSPVLDTGGAPVGRVLSGTLSPMLNEAIGSALVPAAFVCGPLFAEIRGARIPLHPVKPPFVPMGKSANPAHP